MNLTTLKVLNKIFLFALFSGVLCLYTLPAQSQQVSQVYIFTKTPVVAHPGSTLSIYSDIVNTGTLISHTNSNIVFYAKNWENRGASKLPDESPTGLDATGGIFTFSGIYLNAQNITTSNPQPYNGFPNLNIDNQQHVTLQAGNLYVNNNLNFTNGSLILNNLDLSLGRLGKGTVTGYSQNGFVVTGTDFTGGSLIRSTLGTTQTLVFPVGTTTSSYTPASVAFTGLANNLKLRVAEGVFEKPAFPEYVYKTWELAMEYPDATATAALTLQHNTSDEGLDYFRNRTADAYITRYNKNIVGLYDIIPPTPSVTPGTITDRTAIGNAYMNTRTAITRLAPVEYFTKSTIKKLIDQNTPSFIPDAISPNGDGLNDTYRIVKRLPTDVVRLEIYTRNQVLVYQAFNYLDSFDGTGNVGGFMGRVLPDGIYYYLISANNAKGVPGYLLINR
jgi:gliding motility-associated-like protein